MSSSSDYSKILWQAYEQFLLPLGGKKVPTPYRRNEFGSYQKLGPEFQGKSSPQTLTKTTIRLTKEQGFNLSKASVEEIQHFMRKNKLGIDCSGFTYRMLDFLVKKLGLGSLEKAAGFEHVGRTNVAKLTSDEFTMPIENFGQTQPGDLIKINDSGDILHIMVILENKDDVITYAHSSSATNPDGVSLGKIISGKFIDLKVLSYNPSQNNEVRHLKIFA